VPLHYVYDISYTEDFNPNGRTKKYFETSILRFNLDEQLRRSVLKYNKMIAENEIQAAGLRDDHKEEELAKPSTKKVHQCKHCFTIYDPEFGDLLNNIPAGVPFAKLPASYVCPTCEAEKKDFKVVEQVFNLFVA
jgi:rubredoxin